jgi:pimeloyl-ACP methyl ester carboxylesterase
MRIDIGDCKLFFDVEGARLRPDGARMREVPTLLLLHGGPGFDHALFKPDFAVLAEVAQLVYIDHRGNGRSDRGTKESWNLATWGDDLYEFCRVLEIQKPIVLGWSFGGFVALSYATRHPEHPAKLILSNTAANWRMGPALSTFERLGGQQARDAAQAWFETPNEKTLLAYTSTCLPLYSRRPPSDLNFLERCIVNMEVATDFLAGEQRTFDFLPALSRIVCPTLMLAGEDDPITPINFAEEIAAGMSPGLLSFERFPNAGHNLVIDAPERYFRLIKEFVAGGGPGS